MARIWTRLAALAALFIGVMAVVAGAPVLLGRHPGWHVIGWVPAYNLTMGFISALVTSVLLWLGRPVARVLALLTLLAHAGVLVFLVMAQGDTVATDTLRAMVTRIMVWVGILVLLVAQHRADARQEKSLVNAA